MTAEASPDHSRSGGRWHQHHWDRVLAGLENADRYFARPGLVRKDRLAAFVPAEHHPDTVAVRSLEELARAVEELRLAPSSDLNPDNDELLVCGVLKKAHSSNAHGIRFLTQRDAKDIALGACNVVVASEAVWVLQRHIVPWLHQGRKFHLRALLLCVGDLQAYLHEDVRMLLATEPFSMGCRDPQRLSALVTNMSANTDHPGYSAASQNLPLADLGLEFAAGVLDKATWILAETLRRVRAAGRRQFFTTPNCWELFGADFLIEGGTGRVILLEVNPSPSLSMYGDGPAVRAALLGDDPLAAVPPSVGWRPLPLAPQSGAGGLPADNAERR